MKNTVSEHDFMDWFRKYRPESFSYEGLQALFEFLDENEPEDAEFDPVAIDGSYSEGTIEEFASNYSNTIDIEDNTDVRELLEWFSDKTEVIRVEDTDELTDIIIIREF